MKVLKIRSHIRHTPNVPLCRPPLPHRGSHPKPCFTPTTILSTHGAAHLGLQRPAEAYKECEGLRQPAKACEGTALWGEGCASPHPTQGHPEL